MPRVTEGMKILLENAKTFSERNEITSLLESEAHAIDNMMVTNLYKSAISKTHIDFGNIPESKGDVTKYSGYASMNEVLKLIGDIANAQNVQLPEVDTVNTALDNLVANRELFVRGFKLDKEFVIFQYNILVYAAVEATSTIISSYVEYIKRPDAIDFKIIKNPLHGGAVSILNLDKFNKAVKNGDFSKAINVVLKSGRENFAGAAAMGVLITGAVLSIVPIMRELIFAFYYSRMKLSDYLKQQAELLEINKQSIDASTRSARDKQKIVKAQSKRIHFLNTVADKIKVDAKLSGKEAGIELKKENKNWTLGSVQAEKASTDNNGFQLI